MLYLIDEPLAEIGLRTARDDPDGTVVLIQDGVLLDPDLPNETVAVSRDVAVRGVDLPDRIEPITYERLVERIVTEEVRSFV